MTRPRKLRFRGVEHVRAMILDEAAEHCGRDLPLAVADPRFLAQFADRGVADALARVDEAAGQREQPLAGQPPAFNEQDVAGLGRRPRRR